MQNGQIEMYLEFLRTLNESTDDYLFLWDLQGKNIWYFGNINKHYALQETKDSCTEDEVFSIVYPKDTKVLSDDHDRIMRKESVVHNLNYRWIDKNGEIVWISCRGKVFTESDGTPTIMVGRVSDSALRYKVDTLTKLFNKTKMSEDLERVFKTDRNGFTLLLGVDDMKKINMRKGRDYGNEVLKKVGKALEDTIDNPQYIYRWDGDCFAVRIHTDNPDDVYMIYDQIKKKLKDVCSISAGAVEYKNLPVRNREMLYQYVEATLDRAKKSGKNNLMFFSSEYFEKELSELELVEELRESVQHGCKGFSLVYQPQVEKNTYRVFGAEALLRYESPKRGRIMPGEFIAILERTGLICEVGLWVLETALKQCKEWRQKNPDFHMSVNVSYVQLQNRDIAERVIEVLNRYDLPGEALTLEVTESMQLQDYTYYNKVFYKWKKAGIDISVDDFGTGYSSLGYLKNLRIDEIKIDRCFVNGIQFSGYNYRLLNNMLELAHSSQIRVCCEGVEEEAELEVLDQLEPDLMQGFFFSKPCDKDQFEDLYIASSVPDYQERIKTADHKTEKDKLEKIEDVYEDCRNLEMILGAMDELIYVCDLETHEVVYMNPAACSVTGIHDYKGKKCYKVIQGEKDICKFCNNDNLKTDKFLVLERDNPFWNRHFLIKDKLISWNGRPARLEIAVERSE